MNKRRIFFGIILVMILALSIAISGCAGNNSAASNDQENKAEEQIFAMDTYMTITAYGGNSKKAVKEAVEEVKRIDELLSTGKESSEIYKINNGTSDVLSADGAYLMEKSLELYKNTAVFNIAVYPLMEQWGFTTKNYKVPKEADIERLLSLAKPDEISFDRNARTVNFGISGMQIDFGGIAKGYTSARIMKVFKDNGIKSGIVNLGGNVQTLGGKPDGSNWRIAVQSPDKNGDYAGVLEIKDKAVITSGGYERFFEENGVTYHHIIDPATGKPAESGLQSVTIVSEDGTLADGLSTSLFIMGQEKAIEFWRANSKKFQFVLLTNGDKLLVSEGLNDSFSSERYQVEIVKKES